MKRFFCIFAAYAAACLAAASTASLIFVAEAFTRKGIPENSFSAILFALYVGSHMTARIALSAAPFAILAIAIAEISEARKVIYFVLAGAMIPILHLVFSETPMLDVLKNAPSLRHPIIWNRFDPMLLLFAVPSGAIAGLTYWWIMGFAPERKTRDTEPSVG